MKYAVIIEKADNNLAAYVPDLPGCVAVGDTREEVLREIGEAIAFHLEVCGRMDCPSLKPPASLRMLKWSRLGESPQTIVLNWALLDSNQ